MTEQPADPGPRTRVAMLVKNSFEYDARVRKEAVSLVTAGCDVTVVALHVPGVTAREETRPDGIHVVRVPRIYGRLARLAGASTTTPGATAQAAGTPAAPSLRRRAQRRVVKLVGWLPRLLNTAVVNRRMTAAALAVHPHVVHAHDLNTVAAATAAARRAGAALVYDSHELHTARNGMGPLRRAWGGWWERRYIRRMGAVITATDTWADLLRDRYDVPRPFVVRNVPPLLPVQPRDLRTLAPVPAGHAILLYQGSVQTARGIEETIAALEQLPACDLVVVGYGAHLPVLRELAHRSGVGERVHFVGPIPNTELVDWSASADVGLCCIVNSSYSYFTSLPNKLFEYAMAGIPVVASDFPEMGKVVKDYGYGEVCDPADPSSIAGAVRRILDRPGDYRAMCEVVTAENNWGLEQTRLFDTYRALGVTLRFGATDG